MYADVVRNALFPILYLAGAIVGAALGIVIMQIRWSESTTKREWLNLMDRINRRK